VYKNDYIDFFPDVLSPDICQEIISRFEFDTANQMPGSVLTKGGVKLDTKQKLCTELNLSEQSDWQDLDKELFLSLEHVYPKVVALHPDLQRIQNMHDTGYRIKRYLPGEYFHSHIDVASKSQSERFLSVIWYLNDVAEGGETVFIDQERSITPILGSLITFPPFWTHTHRGTTPVSGPKYIVTTWMAY